jgi:hypothetical protein
MGSKGVGVTIESYGKLEILYINVDNSKWIMTQGLAFVKDAKGISFKNRLKGHINWRKVRNFNVI